MARYDFDLVVLGAGSGGISAANLGANLGKRTALVEKNRIGGECTWTGCVPSKALIKAAEVAHEARNAERYGLKWRASSELDGSRVMDHVRRVIASVYEEEKPEVFEEHGIKTFIGEPHFVDPHTINVNDQTVTSRRFIISTGSSPFVPPVEGLSGISYLTNENLFEIETLPDSIVILGGGPIGSEMASALVRLGVGVTVVEMAPHILSREDEELAGMLMREMTEEGVKILCGRRAVKAERGGPGVRLTLQSKENGAQTVEAEKLLVAVGRRPNLQGLDLENAGVEYTERGIVTDRTMRTSSKSVYAIGDVVGPYLFSHMAEYWASIAVPNAVLPLPVKKKANYDSVPWSTFTDPELARCGITEREARGEYGDKIRVFRFEYEKVDRAKTDLATVGMSKFVLSRKGKILGIHILGQHAAELLHEALLAKTMGLTFDKIMNMIHVYPTYGDLVKRPSAQFYGDKLRDSFFVKLLQRLRGGSS